MVAVVQTMVGMLPSNAEEAFHMASVRPEEPPLRELDSSLSLSGRMTRPPSTPRQGVCSRPGIGGSPGASRGRAEIDEYVEWQVREH